MTGSPTRRQVLRGTAGGVLASSAVISQSHAASAAATYTAPNPRVRIDLNAGWRFTRTDVAGAEQPGFDDSGWTSVNTPHTWNAVDGADGGNNYYRGVGWYRRHYTVPSELAGKRLYLQFAGVNQVADVWGNGTYLGQHKGGYSRFRFSVTGVLVTGGDNVIAVKVTNARDTGIAPVSADYTFEGGIYRNVSLLAVDNLHVRMEDYAGPGVYLRQSDVTATSATVTVTTKLWNDANSTRSVVVRSVIADKSGNIVAEAATTAQTLAAATGAQIGQTVGIDRPRLWNGLADPYLYTASVEIHDVTGGTDRIADIVTERLGLRSFAVHPDTGFHLNGGHLHLHGVNLHHERAGKGWAMSDADHVQDFDLLRELGANAVRMAHYQHDQKDYELADERGLILWAEIPLVNSVTDSTAFTASTQNQLRELIRQNYNHPSIVFWGIGNELTDYNGTATNTLLASLADIIESEDPDRLSTYAVRSEDPDNAQAGLHTRVTGFNKYLGWYYGSKDGELGAWADALHSNSPSRRIGISEYGAGANTAQHALNPPKPEPGGSWHPEEYQSLYHEAYWKQLAARPYIWGTFFWAMFDFASDGRNEGGRAGINDKGLVTHDRQIRKDAFYWYKANWATTPTLYITSRRWTQRTDAVTELKVYSNADTVTATLNGPPLGSRSSGDRIFRWADITLRPGQNTVTVTATIDGATYTDRVVWTLA
ncbi:glycoside hydrolase family 2 protein [Streptomyces justiciae]|uniref:glycoside hydrolase family 2 protein n=1 Tax=Streptomyces justiciae TaxID=2780140 RepID=UPI0018814D9A|nr:glycoside hydrolase family 2 TIM barrel-domain containing protein [Streptomyces justiciae]MBE8472164.1 glycoside hydrolase family 2 protein [Streptomyces justiciae]